MTNSLPANFIRNQIPVCQSALKFSNQAHTLTPKDFCPCTLLGAINIEMGNYSTGLEWYEKAKEREAIECSIDYDLRGILLRAEKTKREEIRAFLLREDPKRYKRVRNFKVICPIVANPPKGNPFDKKTGFNNLLIKNTLKMSKGCVKNMVYEMIE